MEDKIVDLLGRPGYVPLNASEIASALKLQRNLVPKLCRILDRLERAGRIARIKQGQKYGLPSDADLISGRIRMNRQGVGFLQSSDPKIPAVRIPGDATGTAFHGDRVLVRRDTRPRIHGRTDQGEVTGRVVRVLEPARQSLVGTLRHGRNFLYVIPDDPRITQDIYVPPPSDVGRPAREGDKVVVELKHWESRHANPEGEIIEVLGPPDAEGVDMLSVIRQYGLPLHFPRKVLQEAKSFGTQIKADDFRGRVDCREHLVITIDPIDAKDFDDAICVQPQSDGKWRLWVHIADVSHYVTPGSALDEEALKRGNSTYLVDRVIPMLPEVLSNELCSLKPNVDRLTKCVELLLSREGAVLKSQFYPAVINSQCRFHYRQALEVLQRDPLNSIEEMLHQANTLAQLLRRSRFRSGSLDLDFPETKILLDDQGRVQALEKVENDISHQLIEEFMLLANETVAARLMSLNRPAVYRIHESPNPQRLQEFREDVLSHRIPCGDLSNRREVQKLLASLSHSPLGSALKIGFLKSLMRARYAVEPVGHYGLAKKKYTHFTSPIRRYADLLVHRALFHHDKPLLKGSLPDAADHISERERNSDDAERDSRDVKLFAFLQQQIASGSRQHYAALVTDVRNFGFFVDVPGLGMSGLVPVSGLADDFYVFDPTRAQLVGRRLRRTFKLGQKLTVHIAKVDTFKRQVDFAVANLSQDLPRHSGPRVSKARQKYHAAKDR